MSMVAAPSRLPFAPRPLSTELLSSWLLRVAAANYVSLADLLQGFDAQYPEARGCNGLIDCSLSTAGFEAWSTFCRVPIKSLQALDLRYRAPKLNPALVLRFSQTCLPWPRESYLRARYAFCPACLSTQAVPHVRWDWSLACLIRCTIHRTPLRDGCETCGEPDPLSFSASRLGCKSCGVDLAAGATRQPEMGSHIQIVEDAYRAALSGLAPHPRLLGKTTDLEFRRFIDDMLQLLSRNLSASAMKPELSGITVSIRRKDILKVIAELIRHAAPTPDPRLRRLLHDQSCKLWSTLLQLVPDYEGPTLEGMSQRWPLALRRRFATGLRDRKQKRWPYTPYKRMELSSAFKYKLISSISDLVQ